MSYPKNYDMASKWDYKFWDTQPVTKLNEKVNIDGQIEPDKLIEEISTEALRLPEDFEWCSFNLSNISDCTEISEFINNHYVEDSNGKFRLQYKADFIEWIYKNSKHISIGVKMKSKNLLVACISAKIGKYQVNKNKLDMAEVNLLCVHKSLRSKRLAPVLIKELTRQANLLGYSKALYTASNYLPTPILTAKYFHRAINITTLYETGFVTFDKSMDMDTVKKSHKLPKKFKNEHFMKVEERHLEQMFELFNDYMDKYNLHPIFTQEEFNHLFYDNKYVVCYVLEDTNKNVLDFISYYNMQSNVLKNNEKYKYIRSANLFYYTSMNEVLFLLIKDLMIAARNNGIDVFNVTDIMENDNILRELGFEEGTGVSNYYLYNWQIRPLKNMQCSLILI